MSTNNVLLRGGIRYAVAWPPGYSRNEVEDWCRELYGSSGLFERWFPMDYTIQFRNKADRNWFLMRWGQ